MQNMIEQAVFNEQLFETINFAFMKGLIIMAPGLGGQYAK